MKLALIWFLFMLHLSAMARPAVDCQVYKKMAVEELPFEITFHYQQKNPALQDLAGDVALIRLVYAMPKNLWWMLRAKNEKLENQNQEITKFKDCAYEIFSLNESDLEAAPVFTQRTSEIKSDDKDVIIESALSLPDKTRLMELFQDSTFVIEGKIPPFYPVKLANMFNRVIQEEAQKGIPPELGEIHQWSKGFIRKHYLKYFPFTSMSKVLLALSRGETSRFMITGEEENLKEWILKQEVESISLDKMFRASYQINQGNVYNAILTIENVLAQSWRTPNRSELPITKRLKHFTNTIGKDDRFGNWYHLFGIMLYGYVKNNFSAKMIGTIEGIGSELLQTEKEYQENILNRKGGKVGVLLSRWIKSGSWSKRMTTDEYLDEKYYLHRQTDYDRSLHKRLKRAAKQ